MDYRNVKRKYPAIFEILRMIERKKGIKIKYTEFSCEDFCNINKMIEMINKYGKNFS